MDWATRGNAASALLYPQPLVRWNWGIVPLDLDWTMLYQHVGKAAVSRVVCSVVVLAHDCHTSTL